MEEYYVDHYGHNDPDTMNRPIPYIKQEVISAHRRCVYQYNISSDHLHMYENTFHPRLVLLSFLDTPRGSRILEMGVAVSVQKMTNVATCSIEYRVIAHFINQQQRDYEKWAMLEKLAGNIS
jgi:hypothetical protein